LQASTLSHVDWHPVFVHPEGDNYHIKLLSPNTTWHPVQTSNTLELKSSHIQLPQDSIAQVTSEQALFTADRHGRKLYSNIEEADSDNAKPGICEARFAVDTTAVTSREKTPEDDTIELRSCSAPEEYHENQKALLSKLLHGTIPPEVQFIYNNDIKLGTAQWVHDKETIRYVSDINDAGLETTKVQGRPATVCADWFVVFGGPTQGKEVESRFPDWHKPAAEIPTKIHKEWPLDIYVYDNRINDDGEIDNIIVNKENGFMDSLTINGDKKNLRFSAMMSQKKAAEQGSETAPAPKKRRLVRLADMTEEEQQSLKKTDTN